MKEGSKHTDIYSTSGLLQCQQQRITQSITLLLQGGQGAADILTSGARPQALCSVMGGPALCSAQVSHVPIQHMRISIGAKSHGCSGALASPEKVEHPRGSQIKK